LHSSKTIWEVKLLFQNQSMWITLESRSKREGLQR